MPTPLSGLLIAVAVAFAARALLRLTLARDVRNSDVFFHLSLVRMLRERGWTSVAREIKADYPYGFPWLLSRLPASWVEAWERVNGAVWDSLHVILFAVVFAWFAGDAVQPATVWLWAPLLLALAPGWLYVGLAPRAYDGTERVFAEFLLALCLTALWVYLETGAVVWLAASLGVGAFVLNSSKFSSQVMVAFSLVIAAATQRWEPLLLYPLSAILASAVPWGVYPGVLRGQLRHLRWYAGAVRTGKIPAAKRNSLAEVLAPRRRHGMAGVLHALWFRNTYVIALLHHLPLVVVMGGAVAGRGALPADPYVWGWMSAGILTWLATSLRRFLHLGEAERYLFYAAVPEYYIIGYWLDSIGLDRAVIGAMLAYSVGWWVMQQYLLMRSTRRSRPQAESMEGLLAALADMPRQRILTVGESRFMWEVAYRTRHTHFRFLPLADWDRIFLSYPYPRWEAVSELDIGLVAVDFEAVEGVEAAGLALEFPFDRLATVLVNDHYGLYRVNGNTMTARE